MGKVRYIIVIILVALFFCVGIPSSFMELPYIARMLTHHLFHVNVIHVGINSFVAFMMYRKTNIKELSLSYAIASISYVASIHPAIGFSNFLYATIGMRTPSLKSSWWRSRETIAFLTATLLMAVIPNISATTHIMSFTLGVLVAVMNRIKRRIDDDYEKATGK